MKGSGPACSKSKKHCSPPVVEEPKQKQPKQLRFSSETKKNIPTNKSKAKSTISPIHNKTRRKAVRAYNRRYNNEYSQKEQGIQDMIKNWDPSMRVPFSSGGSQKRNKRQTRRNKRHGKKTRKLRSK